MLWRLLFIVWLSARYRLDTLWHDASHQVVLTTALKLLPIFWLPASAPRGVRLRRALESMGPIAIKFGQALSTRRDLLAEDIADELAKLQDQAPPFAVKQAKQIIHQALGAPVEQLFKYFNPVPLAAASVAQVHLATLISGEEVIVKVLRPNIHNQVKRDLDLLATAAKIMHSLAPSLRLLKPMEVVEQYARAVYEELDLRIEAANTAKLKHNFKNSPLLYVPQVYWDYCCQNVAVMERIHGIAIDKQKIIKKLKLNQKYLAEIGVKIFFIQVFQHNFFHADMHPGNVYVDTDNPEKPNYIALDCAVMASLKERDRYYLARNLLAIFQRDYTLAVSLLIQSNWVPDNTPVHEMARALAAVCEPILDKPLGNINFGKLLTQFFKTAQKYNMQILPELVLLQKTLLQVEGLGRQLYPSLDFWSIAQPFLKKWLQQRYSPRRIYEKAQLSVPMILSELPDLSRSIMNYKKNNDTLTHILFKRMQQENKQWRRSFFLGLIIIFSMMIILVLISNTYEHLQ